MPSIPETTLSTAKLAARSIDPTLVPLIFRDKDPGNTASVHNFTRHLLPLTASVLCRFCGLLVQACWVNLKRAKSLQEIPSRLDALLLQIWAGHQRYTDQLAMSVLYEATQAPEASRFRKLVRGPSVLLDWKRIVNRRQGKFREMEREISQVDLHDLFSRLLSSLPILKAVRFDGASFHFDDAKVSAFPLIKWSDAVRNPLYLYAFDEIQSRPEITFEDPYSNFAEEYALREESSEKEQLLLLRQILGIRKVPEQIIFLFGTGYEHIQNLARAIVETSDPGCKKALKALLQKHQQAIDLYGQHINELDRVTLLIADHGPNRILQEILRHNQDLYEEYLKFFEQRNLGQASKWEQMLDHLRASKQKAIEKILDEEDRQLQFDREELAARCAVVLCASGLRTDKAEVVVESVDMRIKWLNDWSAQFSNGKWTVNEVGNRIAKLVERTLRFLVCFYSGLGAYYASSQCAGNSHLEHEKSMTDECRRRYTSVARKSIGSLCDEFRRILSECDPEVINELLGRKRICNPDNFNKKLVTNEWTAVFTRLKHDKPDVTPKEMEEFIGQTTRLFRFLRSGGIDMSETAAPSLDPIYPMVISFREAHRKRDGLLIYNYEIYSLSDKPISDIRILTWREYVPNEEYYCIPLFNRSTRQWWLDPFLIRCSMLDPIFSEE